MTDCELRMAKQITWLAARLEELAPTHCPASLGKYECQHTPEECRTVTGYSFADCWVSAARAAVAAQEKEVGGGE